MKGEIAMQNILYNSLKVGEKYIKKLISFKKHLPFNYNKFWAKRYEKHGFSILYCGNKGYNIEENEERYDETVEIFSNFIKKHQVKKTASILDIGCGVGVYADYFLNNKFTKYKGLDISGEIMDKLNNKFKNGFKFEKKDVFTEHIEGKYDLIIMINFALHIIEDKHFKFLMANVGTILNKNGLFIVSESINRNERDSYYTRRRPLDYYKECFDLEIIDKIKVRNKQLIAFKKK